LAPPIELKRCVSGADVAALLKRDYKKNLVYILYGMTRGAKYRQFSIPKRSGGKRLVSAPAVALLKLQRELAELLAKDFLPRAPAHGFIQNRSISTNAARHVAQRWVLNIDLKDFFGAITFPRIYGRLQANNYNYSPDVARIVAHAACVNGCLATGGALSPIISNIICDKLDAEISRLAKTFGCQYTRYADDITISTNRYRFPLEIASFSSPDSPVETTLGSQLTEIVTQNGFVINASKTRLLGKGVRQEVTGLVVNQKRNVPRSTFGK
jgi:RNA-directed DNA polymerase